MKKITAKFASTCADTGARIKKGDSMIYNYSTRKCYSMNSQTAKNFERGEAAVNEDAHLVQAQEEAYFDNFCVNNNI